MGKKNEDQTAQRGMARPASTGTVACDYSQTVFARGIPEAVDNPRWEEFARAFAPDEEPLMVHKRLAAIMTTELGLKTGARFLEVGGGLGTVVLEMADRGMDVWDLDIVPANVDLVRKVSESLGLNVKVIHGDSVHMPFDDNSFDAIFASSVFEHIHDQKAALDEQIRILKPGSRLMIMDGNLLNPKLLYHQMVVHPRIAKDRWAGLRWLFTKRRAYSDFGIGWHGKDEDVKSVYWWRRTVRERAAVKALKITTSRRLYDPDNLKYRLLEPIAGMIVVVLEKVT